MSNIYGFIRPTDEYMISIGYTAEQLPAFKALWDDYDAEKGPFIYLVQALGTNLYKIGYSTNPESRLINMQTDCPFGVRLAAVIPGTIKDEKILHKKYDHLRFRREWFIFLPDSKELDEIEAHFAEGLRDDFESLMGELRVI
jgi:hypothetical protein